MGATVDTHEGPQELLQGFLIPLAIHGGVFGQKLKTPTPHLAGKTAPNHDTVGVLHSLDGLFALVPADPLRPPDLAPGGPYALEPGLVQIHDFGPVRSSEVKVGLGKFDPFGFHFLSQQRFHGHHSARHFQVDLQGPLDGQLGDHPQFRNACL